MGPHSLGGHRARMGARKHGAAGLSIGGRGRLSRGRSPKNDAGTMSTCTEQPPRLGGAATPAESHDDRYWLHEAPSLEMSRLPLDG